MWSLSFVEYQAGCGGCGTELVVLVEQPALSESDTTSETDDFAFRPERPGPIAHGPVIGNFEFQRRVALLRPHHGVDRAAHRAVEQRGCVAAMNAADRVVDGRRGVALEDHKSFFHFDRFEVE